MEKINGMDDIISEDIDRNDWKKYKIWLIDNVRQLRREVKDLRDQINIDIIQKINKLENEISKLQIKSGVWGAIAGLLGVTIAMLVRSQTGK